MLKPMQSRPRSSISKSIRAEINKNVKADVAILGDVKETLPAADRTDQKRSHDDWLEEFQETDKIELKK